ncbi:MAG: DUF1641 domain-containing protein [Candidatus Electrothrix sp. ATG2]|nr:DUF1641 domain-containing protein [Candidatus Electrothrix sp. ATG2]
MKLTGTCWCPSHPTWERGIWSVLRSLWMKWGTLKQITIPCRRKIIKTCMSLATIQLFPLLRLALLLISQQKSWWKTSCGRSMTSLFDLITMVTLTVSLRLAMVRHRSLTLTMSMNLSLVNSPCLDKNVNLEEVGDMVGQSLASSNNIAEALKTLNSIMEFKRDFAPYGQDMFHELVLQLQTALQGFEGENLQELIRQFIVNMGNMAEMMKQLNSFMDLKRDVAQLSGPVVDDIIERLDGFKKRGLFDDLAQMLEIGERVSSRVKAINLDEVKPVTGIFGMLSAMKRPEVQEGMGILLELAAVMSVLKKTSKEPV